VSFVSSEASARSGHSTLTRTEPMAHVSPESSSAHATRPRGVSIAVVARNESQPPSEVTGTPTNPTRATPVSPAKPPVWSSCACVSTTASSLLTPCRPSAALSSPSSDPQSTSMEAVPSLTSRASPWPTSNITSVADECGTGTTAHTAVATAAAARTARARPSLRGSGHASQRSTASPASATPRNAASPERETAAPGTPAQASAARAHRPNNHADASRSFVPAAPRACANTTPARASGNAAVVAGTATRFAAGATTDTTLKAGATTGSVAAWAVSVAPAKRPRLPGRGRRAADIHDPARSPNSSNPPTAVTESWSDSSKTLHGSSAIIAMTATASAAMPSGRRPASRATHTTTTMTMARRVDVCAPVTIA
jgi:hypothetical protein